MKNKKSSGEQWTLKEIKLLEKLHVKEKMPMSKLVNYFPGRTMSALNSAIGVFNIQRYRLGAVNHWESYEVDFLKKNYYILGYKECAAQLKRTPKAIRDKASKLKLVRANWSNEELELVKQIENILTKLKGRSFNQVRDQIYKLGLRKK